MGFVRQQFHAHGADPAGGRLHGNARIVRRLAMEQHPAIRFQRRRIFRQLGLGGIWVEALGDVQLLPGTADETQIREALGKLRSAKLLAGVRGAPASDVDAVIKVVLAIGRIMQTMPEVTEIDVNPLMVHGKGHGATALDALIVTA